MNLKSFIRVFVTLLTATLLSCVLVSAQDISLNMRDVKVSRVIAEIQARYGYSVVVKSSGIDMERKVSVSLADVDVETAVRKVFEGQPVSEASADALCLFPRAVWRRKTMSAGLTNAST